MQFPEGLENTPFKPKNVKNQVQMDRGTELFGLH